MDSSSSKDLGLKIGKKVGFDILSHCYDNAGLANLSKVLINILKSSDEACLEFMQTLLDEDDAEPDSADWLYSTGTNTYSLNQ